MKKEDEIIIVCKRSELFTNEKLAFQGFTSDGILVDTIIHNIDQNYKSMRRGSSKETDVPLSKNAELNLDYKQPIPYVVIRKGDKLFAYERLKGGGESRLHSKISLGAGGHMNPLEEDYWSFEHLLNENMKRELDEELEIDGEIDVKIIGLINDDSEEVSKVHIGIIGVIHLKEEDDVKIREVDQLKGDWISIEELEKDENYNRLENWSKIIVDQFKGVKVVE